MTAIRNFPNAPQRPSRSARWAWHTPAFLLAFWQALQANGQRRAAWELEAMAGRQALGNPQLARQLREAAAACRRAAVLPAARTDGSSR
jgi:hypothetical protein